MECLADLQVGSVNLRDKRELKIFENILIFKCKSTFCKCCELRENPASSPVELWLNLEVTGLQTNLLLLERRFILVYHTKSPPKTPLGNFFINRNKVAVLYFLRYHLVSRCGVYFVPM